MVGNSIPASLQADCQTPSHLLFILADTCQGVAPIGYCIYGSRLQESSASDEVQENSQKSGKTWGGHSGDHWNVKGLSGFRQVSARMKQMEEAVCCVLCAMVISWNFGHDFSNPCDYLAVSYGDTCNNLRWNLKINALEESGNLYLQRGAGQTWEGILPFIYIQFGSFWCLFSRKDYLHIGETNACHETGSL